MKRGLVIDGDRVGRVGASASLFLSSIGSGKRAVRLGTIL